MIKVFVVVFLICLALLFPFVDLSWFDRPVPGGVTIGDSGLCCVSRLSRTAISLC